MAKTLFVGSLAWATTNESLAKAFSAFGQVLSANVIKDKMTARSKGFGFVEMANDDEAAKAIAGLNGQMLDGRTVAVNEARPREEGPRREYRG